MLRVVGRYSLFGTIIASPLVYSKFVDSCYTSIVPAFLRIPHPRLNSRSACARRVEAIAIRVSLCTVCACARVRKATCIRSTWRSSFRSRPLSCFGFWSKGGESPRLCTVEVRCGWCDSTLVLHGCYIPTAWWMEGKSSMLISREITQYCTIATA